MKANVGYSIYDMDTNEMGWNGLSNLCEESAEACADWRIRSWPRDHRANSRVSSSNLILSRVG